MNDSRRCFFLFLAFLAVVMPLSAKPLTHTFHGKLIVPRGAGTPESYKSGYFQILTFDKRLVLTSSPQVSESKLREFQEQMVTIETVLVDPGDLPKDPEHEGEKRPQMFRVVKIKPYSGQPFETVTR